MCPGTPWKELADDAGIRLSTRLNGRDAHLNALKT